MKAFAGFLTLLLCISTAAAQARQAPDGSAIAIPLSEAIDRALKYNLASILGEQSTRFSRAARLRALSELLPKVNGAISETVQQINLAAFGFGGFPGQPPVVGPFSVFDARARYSQPLVDFKLLHELRAASEKLNASTYSQQDAREVVVLVATNLYLQSVAGASRVEAARAQLKTAEAVYERAVGLKNSGLAPGIDVLRAQVELQAQQQRVLATGNELAKQKLNLARAIGLPLGQQFTQPDGLVTAPPSVPVLDEMLKTALEMRPDYRQAAALVRAAEETRKAARSRGLPSLQVNADYGDIGRTPGNSHGTMTVQGTLMIPLYTGGRTRAEILESDALFDQRKAEAENLRERIELEIRTAALDIRSASEQVKVAESARELARQQLAQAQDRFAAGVTDSLEVVQAQGATVAADENYISSLYSLNVAQALLARAMGAAEKTIKSYFGGR